MISALINLVIYLVVLLILYYIVDYVLRAIPVPDPPARLIRILIVVIFALIIVVLLLNMLGVGGVAFPRLVSELYQFGQQKIS